MHYQFMTDVYLGHYTTVIASDVVFLLIPQLLILVDNCWADPQKAE